ncbi:MAG: NADP-dependent oxidoreductase [Thermoanaerobaculia bacterium]|nr:NADP-dependent oxidoreductase [Thermoanaerobaculia bacterium]
MSDVLQNQQIRLIKRPEGLPNVSIFESTSEPIPSPGDGEVLVRVVYLSLDPAMRGWMNDRKSYVPPVRLGDVMRGLTVGEVVESRAEGFSPGDRVSGILGWQQYGVAEAKDLHKLPEGLPLPLFLGPLGMTGLTAYFGLLDIGLPKEGETVLVSGAAGAVGSVVGQIAKIHGCRVVGTAGTDEKCQWLTEELGFDIAINYKTVGRPERTFLESLIGALRKACPQGVDVYFDNVGGDTLDAALSVLNRGARIPLCGGISQYNASETHGPRNYLSLLVNRARMEGFLVFDFADRYGEALQQLGQWVSEGKIKYRFEVVDGLAEAPSALLRLFDGSKKGKLMVQVGPVTT